MIFTLLCILILTAIFTLLYYTLYSDIDMIDIYVTDIDIDIDIYIHTACYSTHSLTLLT